MDFGGKVCVVTGASSGIGRAVARNLAASGASVCAVARRGDVLADLVEEMGASAAGHSYIPADVSSPAQVSNLAAQVAETYGACHVLVNSAGIGGSARFEDGGIELLERVMATNFYGAVRCTQQLLPLLAASAPAHVVNIASLAGRFGLTYGSAYCASKFALVGWTESVRAELSQKDVFVTVIEPGPVPTPGFPQSALVNNPVLRFALVSDDGVARAVRDSIAHRRAERVVPRWYYLLQFPKLMAPSLFRAVQERVLAVAGDDRKSF